MSATLFAEELSRCQSRLDQRLSRYRACSIMSATLSYRASQVEDIGMISATGSINTNAHACMRAHKHTHACKRTGTRSHTAKTHT